MRTNPNLTEKVAQAFRVEAEKMAKQMAEYLGKPTDAQEIDTDEELTLWNQEKISAEEASQRFIAGEDIDAIMDQRFPNRRFMFTYQRPDPEQQVQYAERMKKLSTERGFKEETPNVHNESAGELQSTIEPY